MSELHSDPVVRRRLKVPEPPLSVLGDTPGVPGFAELLALEPTLVRVPEREGAIVSAVRRAIDVAVSALALLVFGPLILCTALFVKLDTRGPAFFRQTRLGRGGMSFKIVKLRGMFRDARERFPELYAYDYSSKEAEDLHFHFESDPRVTRAGRLFRRTSVDELANFWNVLVGEMSLVGPRPQIPEMFPYYGDFRDVILSVRPGIFSLPKVLGRDHVALRETILLDAYYVHRRTLRLDVKIIFRGVLMVLLRRAVL